MVRSFGGALEIIGVRAVINDVQKYLNDAKRIERANEGIDRANLKLQATSRRSAKLAEDALKAEDKLTNAKLKRAGLFTGGGQIITPELEKQRAAATKEVADAISAQEKALNAASVAALSHKSAVSGLSRAQDQLAKSALITNKAFVAGAGILASFAVVGSLQKAISAASEYQQALLKINVLTNTTSAETARLGDAILDMTSRLPSSAAELGAGAYQILSSGIDDTREAMEILEIAAQGQAAGLGEVKDIASLITTVINAYGKENITAAQTTDLLFGAVREGRGEAIEFAKDLGRIVPLANVLGVGFDQLAASMAVLTNAGLNTSQATTALLGILNQIISPSEEARDTLKRYGTSIQEVRKNLQEKGLLQTLADLNKLFGGNVDAIAKLFPEVRGLVGTLSLFGESGQDVIQTLEDVRKSQGATAAAAKEASKTYEFQSKVLKNQVNSAFIELGTAILPSITKALTELNKFLRESRDELRLGAEAIVAFGKGFLTAVVPILSFIKVLKEVKKAIDSIPVIGGPAGLISQGTDFLSKAARSIAGGGPGEAGRESEFFGTDAEALALDESLRKLQETMGLGAKTADKLKESLKETNNEAGFLGIKLPQLSRNVGDSGEESEEAAEKIRQLTEEFQKTSEAAGQVESLIAEIGKFGIVSKELADALGLTTETVGRIQGLDAVARAEQRAAAEAFNFATALSTLATAMQHNGAVAQDIALDLARAALQASQAAAAAVFARPTREVADLGLSLAQAQLRSARTASVINPQISALQRQLSSIDRQIASGNRTRQAASRNAQNAARSQRAQQAQATSALDAIEQALRIQLANLKFANLKVQLNFEAQIRKFDELIASTQERASDLQKSFLKNNEALQRQINEAIGRGDTAGAFALVQQQQAQAKAYQEEADALRDHEQQLEKNRRATERSSEASQDAAQLAEAEIETQLAIINAQQQGIQAQGRAIEATNSFTESVDESSSVLENQRDRIQDQISALQSQTDASREAEQRIQEQIAVYEAETNVLRAMVTAADRTLLTQREQADAARILIEQISLESQAVRDLTELTGKHLIPEMDEAIKRFVLLQEALKILSDPEHMKKFIDQGLTPAQKALGFLTTAVGKSEHSLSRFAQSSNVVGQLMVSAARAAAASLASIAKGAIDAVRSILSAISRTLTVAPRPPAAPSPPAPRPGGPVSRGEGGIFTSPTLSLISERYQPEAIIPLNRPTRARQIISSISPSVLATILPRGTGSAVFAPNISVRGETLDTMEIAAIRAVQRAFREARTASNVSGGFITQGLGPSR